MVLEVVLSILIVSTSLITAFRNESNSISVTLGFITFVLILAFAYSGPEVSILLGLGVTPLLYLLLQTRATSTKQFKARSSVVEKVMTYLSLAPLFGFVVFVGIWRRTCANTYQYHIRGSRVCLVFRGEGHVSRFRVTA